MSGFKIREYIGPLLVGLICGLLTWSMPEMMKERGAPICVAVVVASLVGYARGRKKESGK